MKLFFGGSHTWPAVAKKSWLVHIAEEQWQLGKRRPMVAKEHRLKAYPERIAETGYAGTELGDWGFMPTQKKLAQEIHGRKLVLLGAFTPSLHHSITPLLHYSITP